MKRFLSAVGLCVFLLLFGLFVFLPTTTAQKSLLETLLDLPAPPPPNPLVVNRLGNRAVANFDLNKPPPDDVPLEDLILYWQRVNNYNQKFQYTPEPSPRTMERLMEAIEEDPERLPSLMNAFTEKSEGAEFVKRLYDREMSDKKLERDWRDSVRRWLTYNSNYFSDDLAKVAQTSRDSNEYVTNQDEVLALARVDWEKARPMLDRMLADPTQPVSQTLARWAYYQHAVREKNSIEADRYRKELQETVEDKSGKPGNRDLAMDALVEGGDFEGRDDWYFSLLEDETLHDLRVNGTSYTGLTTILNHSPSDKYAAKMIELSKSSNAAVRSAAVRNLSTLLDDKKREVIEALLPWLENPKWAKETQGGERQQLVTALAEFEMPESVPGLIAVLNEKRSLGEIRGSSNANTMPMNAPVIVMSNGSGASEADYYPFRSAAIVALTTQKDARAATPLRAVLPQVEEWQRGGVVRAILVSHGFSVAEQIDALESIAKNISQPTEYTSNTMAMMPPVNAPTVLGVRGDEDVYVPPPDVVSTRIEPRVMVTGNVAMASNSYNVPIKPLDAAQMKQLLGMQLVNLPDAEEELVTALIDRIGVLDKKDPPMAMSLRRIMQNWNGAAINRLLLQDLKTNRANADAIVKLLSLRKELRDKQWNDVNDARGGSQTALGIAACLIEDTNGYDAILDGESVEAKTAMLSCARLIRAALPVRKVAENLNSPTKILAAAAERYLIAEDSPEARQIVLARHPNEALVLGARTYFGGEDSTVGGNQYLGQLFATVNENSAAMNYYGYSGDDGELGLTERNLQKEVKANRELLGVYAYNNNFVRIYKDKAVFSWQEDKARYRERALETEEFDKLKSYLAAENAGDLPPFLADCDGEEGNGCEGKELLMLGRQGGRRVFTFGEKPKFFAGLEAIFDEMRQPPAKLHYWLEKGVAGLEILFESPDLQAEAVWKTGDDFRVLINNEPRRKEIDREIQQQEEAEDERLIAEADAEDDDYARYEKIEAERRKRRERRAYENYSWHKFAAGKLAEPIGQPSGIEFLPVQNGAPIQSAPGTSGGWKARTNSFEIAANSEGLYKIGGGRNVRLREGYYDQPVVTANNRWLVVTRYGEEEGRQLIRLNLQTNREYVVNFEEHSIVEAVAYLPAMNKILLFGGEYSDYEGGALEGYAERSGEFYFLDPDTGAMQKAKGETRPLAQQTWRPLQPTGKPDEFWAAIPSGTEESDDTQVGTYNARTLAFKPLVKIPRITFDSMRMWVDANVIYFVYQGHLLALPLPKPAANAAE